MGDETLRPSALTDRTEVSTAGFCAAVGDLRPAGGARFGPPEGCSLRPCSLLGEPGDCDVGEAASGERDDGDGFERVGRVASTIAMRRPGSRRRVAAEGSAAPALEALEAPAGTGHSAFWRRCCAGCIRGEPSSGEIGERGDRFGGESRLAGGCGLFGEMRPTGDAANAVDAASRMAADVGEKVGTDGEAEAAAWEDGGSTGASGECVASAVGAPRPLLLWDGGAFFCSSSCSSASSSEQLSRSAALKVVLSAYR